jgi:hypothetical protein
MDIFNRFGGLQMHDCENVIRKTLSIENFKPYQQGRNRWNETVFVSWIAIIIIISRRFLTSSTQVRFAILSPFFTPLFYSAGPKILTVKEIMNFDMTCICRWGSLFCNAVARSFKLLFDMWFYWRRERTLTNWIFLWQFFSPCSSEIREWKTGLVCSE